MKSKRNIQILLISIFVLLLSIGVHGAQKEEFLESLSAEERAYIGESKLIPVAVSPNKGPIQYVDANGEQRGISLDFMNEISSLTGLQFQYISLTGADSIKEALNSSQVLLLSGIPTEQEVKELYQVSFSKSYLSCSYGIVMNRDDNLDQVENLTLALTRGLDVPDSLKEVKTVKRYESIQDCIQAVKERKADFTYGNSYVLEFYSQGYQYQTLSVIPLQRYGQNLCFGISKDADARLKSILDKSIDYIGSEGMMKITVKNVAASTQPITLAAVISMNPQGAMIVTAVIVILVFFAAGSLLMNYKHKNKLLHLEHQKYLLISEIANEYFYEYNFQTDTMVLSKEMAELLGCKSVIHKWRGRVEQVSKVLNLEFSKFSKLYEDKMEKNGNMNHFKEKGNRTLEIQLPLNDGSKRWFCVTRTDIYEGGKRYIVGMLRDIQKDYEEREQLMKKSLCDGLTGIYNAAAAKEFITKILKKKHGGTMFIIDLDYFKRVNDQFGHQMGDKVIRETACILKNTFRDRDIVGRLGGDEFIIFAIETSDNAFIKMKCGQLQEKVNQMDIADGFVQTISIGVVKSDGHESYEQLYQLADAALYLVKEKGRAGFQIANE